MELANVQAFGPALQAAPLYIRDVRPVADAAALALDPRPEIPLAQAAFVPPSSSQTAEVSRSLIGAKATTEVQKIEAIDRVLKPYDTTMLPRAQYQIEQDAEQTEADAQDAEQSQSTKAKDAQAAPGHDPANADEAARARGAPQRPSEPDDSGDSHENHDGPADEYSHLGTNGGEEETQLTSES